MSFSKETQTKQLLQLFPKGDPEYFRSCLEHYKDNAVERVTEKIIESGYYPQLPTFDRITDNRRNACLRILALEVFPDCDVGFLREKVLGYSFAHVDQVANELLQLNKWPERLNYGEMDNSENIHSQSYKDQAQNQLVQDFPQIWKSSIQAVLAENNWDYLKSHDQLQEMGSGGFWESLKNLFMHWQTSHTKHYVQRDLKLARQLEQLEQRSWQAQIERDGQLAQRLNEEEYDREGQSITCGCCYGDQVFESLMFCSEANHAFCHDCVRRYLSEGLFGQGSLRGQARINCISSDPCGGCLPTLALQRVLSQDMWKAYEQSQLEGFRSNEERVQCCACSYFELDGTSQPKIFSSSWLRSLSGWLMWDIASDLEMAYKRLIKTRRGMVLKCKNPECKIDTCLQCQRPFRGLHKCWEKEADGLRLYVEKAMADAVKRTCPKCSLSFQKSDGCNKIVCRCKYTMCYVCRKDISKESYKHFCGHFRAVPGSKCTECNKCDLYKTDPEDQAIELAAEKAKHQYLQANPQIGQKIPDAMIIGPKSRIMKLNEWKKEIIIQCFERVLNIFT